MGEKIALLLVTNAYLQLFDYRIGPGRALSLGVGSLCRWPLNPKSVRNSLVADINKRMSLASPGHYLAVYGPEGVGKSLAISTAVRGKIGVIHVDISTDDCTREIIKKSINAVNRPNIWDIYHDE